MRSTEEGSLIDQLDASELINKIIKNVFVLIESETKSIQKRQRVYIIARVIQGVFIQHFNLMMQGPTKNIQDFEKELHGKT